MQYRRFSKGPWPKLSGTKKIIYRLIAFLIPKANPDFDDNFSEVHYFWLEIDERGQVLREIGFNGSDAPVRAAPLGENHGIFTDMDGAPSPLESVISQDEFERAFSIVADRHRTKVSG